MTTQILLDYIKNILEDSGFSFMTGPLQYGFAIDVNDWNPNQDLCKYSLYLYYKENDKTKLATISKIEELKLNDLLFVIEKFQDRFLKDNSIPEVKTSYDMGIINKWVKRFPFTFNPANYGLYVAGIDPYYKPNSEFEPQVYISKVINGTR